jgi:hypothetical protein
MRITPDLITELKDKEIFVFGSNLSGRHGAGAAKLATKWGAVYGQEAGLQGNTYGIPTKTGNSLKTLDLSSIKQYVDDFISFTKERTDLTFLVTRIGCGLANLSAKEVAPLFKEAVGLENVFLPSEFLTVLTSKPKLRLSHSAVTRFNLCNYEYKLYYIEKIRPTNMSSSLLFGKAIDESCEHYIINRDVEAATKVLCDLWKEQEHNGKLIDLSTSTEIDYHSLDFDHELLIQSDNEFILKDTVHETVSALVKEGLDKERIAYAKWISLHRKGHYLLNKFIEWVDNYVEEVISCQEVISLEDEKGNQVTGKADFVLKIKGIDGPMVVDLKTTTRFYERNSVKESDQLALYSFFLKDKYPEMRQAAYLVLHKAIKKNREKICSVCGHDDSGTNNKSCTAKVGTKRCGGSYHYKINPEATIQFIYDTIPEEKIQSVLESFNAAENSISKEEFPQNLSACERYNGKFNCIYYEYCKSGCMTGLLKKEVK